LEASRTDRVERVMMYHVNHNIAGYIVWFNPFRLSTEYYLCGSCLDKQFFPPSNRWTEIIYVLCYSAVGCHPSLLQEITSPVQFYRNNASSVATLDNAATSQ
jgi:hypothetical protein